MVDTRTDPDGARPDDAGHRIDHHVDHGRTVSNAPWRQWAWPYGAAVIALTLLWMVLPLAWLWMALALVAGFVIARRTIASHSARPAASPRVRTG